jgi:hypothetical protein
MIANLSTDHLAPNALARVADVQAAIIARPYVYQVAARKIGLTDAEYAALRQSVEFGEADYLPMPTHVDAMAGRHRDGRVYVLRNVGVPGGEWGWRIDLPGKTVWVPRECGNLSVVVAPRRAAVAPRAPRRKPAYAIIYPIAPPPVPIVTVAATPVPEPSPVAISVPITSAPAGFGWRDLLPLVPALLWHPSTPPEALPCSEGSNAMGVCR